MYLSWAAFYEGYTDAQYFDVLIPRVIRALASEGRMLVDVPATPAIRLGRFGRSVANVAKEACEGSSAFHLIFVHADTGGRALAETLGQRGTAYCAAMAEACGLRCERCIVMTPRKEMEAWAISDSNAVLGALGFRGDPIGLGLPADPVAAERHTDPKTVLKDVLARVRGTRKKRTPPPFAAIAQLQSLELLRRAPSFESFFQDLRAGLMDIGIME